MKEAQCKYRTFSKPSAITPPSGISYRLTVPSEEQYFGLYVYFLICRIADNTALQMLAVATHHGGWLDPLELVRRIKNDPYQLDRHNGYDKSLSLYRLPADNRKEALKELGNYLPDNDYVNAVRCVLSSVDAAADNSIPVKHPHYQIAVIVNRYLADNKPVYKFDCGNPHRAEFLLPLPDRIVENSEVPVLCLSADACRIRNTRFSRL
ncbi:hypothetical protein FACS189427_13740 [Planctomycetales bacterium]|nr:hypothetical protein FACS189427_13740 [Planctomycetales bacterium]